MKYKSLALTTLAITFLAGCVEIDGYHRSPGLYDKVDPNYIDLSQYAPEKTVTPAQMYESMPSVPVCNDETTVVVYDDDGAFEVPGCIDYASTSYSPVGYSPIENRTISAEEDIDPNTIEGEFPYVEDNKYNRGQVVLQNLSTRVLAYCRGSDDAVAKCVARLEKSCYVKLTDIPYMRSSYDTLKTGTYPTRRWRNGENVPRW